MIKNNARGYFTYGKAEPRMIKIGVCDDQFGIRVMLRDFITEYAMKRGLLMEVKLYETGQILLDNDDHLDILFLDIRMPGLNGIATGKKLREKDSRLKIIYTTAYEHYAIEAFRVRALDYLLKPIDMRIVFHALDEAIEIMGTREADKAILRIKYLALLTNQVRRIEGDGRRIEIYALDKTYVIKGVLKEFEVQLSQTGFKKIKRGVWINPIYGHDMD